MSDREETATKDNATHDVRAEQLQEGTRSKAEASPTEEKRPISPPLIDTSWRVLPAKSTILLQFDPILPHAPPTAEQVIAAAVQLGMPEELLCSAEEIKRVIERSQTSGAPLPGYRLCPDKDSSFSISVDDDKLRATLTVEKATGDGAPLSLKALGDAIKAKGLRRTKGEQLRNDILDFYRGPSMILWDYLLAEGIPPQSGKDRELSWQVEFLPESQLNRLKIAARKLGGGDERFSGIASIEQFPVEIVEAVAFVEPGTLIASLTRPDNGIAGVDVFGRTIPGIPGKDVPLSLHEFVSLQGEALTSDIMGVVERWNVGEVTHLRVRPHVDGKIKISVALDGLSATVDLEAARGTGRSLTTSWLKELLRDEGVVRGVDDEAIAAALSEAEAVGSVKGAVVARGKAVHSTEQSRLKFHVSLASGKGVTIRDGGRADFRNQDRITIVNKDQLIAEIISPEEKPEDGWDVMGNVLRAAEAPRLDLKIGGQIRQQKDERGSVRLFAATAGELVYEGGLIDVRTVMTVAGNVGLATGNIKFSGSVNVAGGVDPGFAILAKGTIKIAKSVQSALVIADESIHVQQGIVGAGKGTLRAKRDITAAFAEHAALMAVGNITIKNACLRCSVKCNGQLVLETEKGRLVGGRAYARDGIDVAFLGNRTGTKTEVSFGQDYIVRDKIGQEESEIEKLKLAVAKADSDLRVAEKKGVPQSVQDARAQKLRILKSIEKRTERLFWLREHFEHHYPSEVVVRGTVYPGVSIESHGRTLDIYVERRGVKFMFDEKTGKIIEVSGRSRAQEN